MAEKKEPKKLGRPKKVVKPEDTIVDEQTQERLDMSDKSKKGKNISVDEITKRWTQTFDKLKGLEGTAGIGTVAEKWNKLNPFLQNQRIKNLYTQARTYSKANISEFVSDPGNHEGELRSVGWTNSSSQQIYYNILRRSCDIPLYHYYKIPDLLDKYNDDKFKAEDKLTDRWLELFNIPATFKTIALEVKREGKSSYLLRNKFTTEGKDKEPVFCTLQKMPTEWIKITGKSQLGFTISFNMMYFMNIANSPSDYGEYMETAWKDMIDKGVVDEVRDKNTSAKIGYQLNASKIPGYSFEYENKKYGVAYESLKTGRKINYMFWLKMPYDVCYTFGSDNSHPWVAPDTMGLMLKLQELTDYGQLAGLIASTPLTAVLTGEIETIANARAGKNESVYTPEVLRGIMDQFNTVTSTNIEAWLWPAKNIKLQQLSTDVNSSEILSTATENFVTTAGEGGLTITTDKPNVAQVVVAKQLAASQQHYVTLQFEQVINFILQHKLGLSFHWKIRIWDDIFNHDTNEKMLKEIVAGGNVALLPKLMSAEGMSLRDTEAFAKYIKSLGFYEDFVTYTQLKQAELAEKQAKMLQTQKANTEGKTNTGSGNGPGRPTIDDGEVTSEATAASKDRGDNIADNRQQQ